MAGRFTKAARHNSSHSIRESVSILLIVYLFSSIGCDTSESAGRAKELQASKEELQQRNANLEMENKSLREANGRCQSQLAAATGGKGLSLEDRQRQLDERKAELDHQRSVLTDRETAVIQRETKIAREEKEFYERTNMTMEQIGEAKQVKNEFDERGRRMDEANSKSEHLLKLLWGGTAAAFGVMVYCFIYIYRDRSRYRRERVYLLKEVAERLPADRAIALLTE